MAGRADTGGLSVGGADEDGRSWAGGLNQRHQPEGILSKETFRTSMHQMCVCCVFCVSLWSYMNVQKKKKLFLLVANMKWETRVGISMMQGWLAGWLAD